MNSNDYRIQLASYHEVKLMLTWAKNEKWNPGLNDALAFQMIDPDGFFIGYLKSEPISCISAVKYCDNFAFLGLYIVHPKYRGLGFGHTIMQHALQYAKHCAIGLDGVIEQQKNYNKLGYQLEYKNIRYSTMDTNNFKSIENPYLIPAEQIPLSEIFEYDRSKFLYDRRSFLTTWLFMSNSKSLVYYDNKKIKGYGVIRECEAGFKIAPLFADSYDIACILFEGLCSSIKRNNAKIFLDIPEPNNQAIKLVETFSMEPVFEVARMYLGKAPTMPLNHIFGITTFEVG